MTYHVVLNRPTDLAAVSQRAEEGQNPRHSMAVLAQSLSAQIHDGAGLTPGRVDRILARATGTAPLWWAIARSLHRVVKPGDAIYCTGEDVGIAVAATCGGMRDVHVTMMVHRIDRAKKKVAFRLLRLKTRVALCFAVSRPQVDDLRGVLHPHEARALFVWDQTDTRFFSPGPASPDKSRAIVMSLGLEQRDYRTLAEATADLPVDVRISGYSADTRLIASAFPDTMPANMTRQFYSWPDLLQLYRDADVVVVSVYPNRYAAGVQALMEGLACGRPVVVVASEGLAGYLDPEAMRLVPPSTPAALRDAITALLADPAEAAALAERGRALALDRHRLERHVALLADRMRALANER